MRKCLGSIRFLVYLMSLIAYSAQTGYAELPAPSDHWGAISFPSPTRTLTAGLIVNRFTEFDGSGRRFNDIRETSGFNFATVSWTARPTRIRSWNLNGWTTNLTIGAGPTRDGLSRFLQNDVVHDFRGLTRVQVGNTRDQTDFMITGSVTKWVSIFGEREEGFAGLAMATGSLYHEPFIRAGMRELSLADVSQSWFGQAPNMVKGFSNFFRISFLARYGRLFTGRAYSTLAPHSMLGQVSLSFADFRHQDCCPPRWGLELGATIESGIFVDLKGDALEERFITFKITTPYVTLENWNDLINQKDFGPTFGLQVMLNLYHIYDDWRERF